MNADWQQHILRVLSTLMALYGLVYMVSAISWPEFFLSSMAINRTDLRHFDRRHPWWLWPMAVFTALCIGVVIYGALYPAISAIPSSMGSYAEDGEWTPTRDYVRMLGTFVGAIGAMTCLEKVAEILVWGPIERKARSALTDAIVHYRTHGDVVRAAAERNLNKELGPQEYEVKGPETQWRDNIRDAIIRRLISR